MKEDVAARMRAGVEWIRENREHWYQSWFYEQWDGKPYTVCWGGAVLMAQGYQPGMFGLLTPDGAPAPLLQDLGEALELDMEEIWDTDSPVWRKMIGYRPADGKHSDAALEELARRVEEYISLLED